MTEQCRAGQEDRQEEERQGDLAGQEDREEEERQGDLIERIVGIFRTNSVKWEREREEGGVMPVSRDTDYSSLHCTIKLEYPPLADFFMKGILPCSTIDNRQLKENIPDWVYYS